MRKKLEHLIFDLNGESDGYETRYSFSEVLKTLELVREKTIEECIEKGYGLYFEDEFDYNPSIININKESLEKLDKESIKV